MTNLKDKINSFLEKLYQQSFKSKAANTAVFLFFFATFTNMAREIYRRILAKGLIPYDGYDWSKNLKYLSTIKEAFETKTLPWFTVEFFQGSQSFLANPEVTFTPLTPFIHYFKTPGNFDHINTVFILFIGFLGTLLLKRQFKLNWLSYAILFLLFFFNGQIIARMHRGHLMWYGYFLLPYLYCFFENLRLSPKKFTIHDLYLVFTLSVLIFFGSLHILLIFTLFYMLYALFNKFCPKKVLVSYGLLAGLSAIRTIPAVFEFLGKRKDGNFLHPFRSIDQLFHGLLVAEKPSYHNPWGGEWVEHNFYIGFIGFGFLLYFVYRHRNEAYIKNYFLPFIVLTLISIGPIYKLVQSLHIPVYSGIRVSTRFLTIPLIFFIFQAVRSFEDHQKTFKAKVPYFILGSIGLYLLKSDLYSHAKLYFLDRSSRPLGFLSGNLLDKPSTYDNLFYFSSYTTGFSLLLMMLLIFRFRSKRS
ncbi:MAG: hypothetical protein ACPGJV_02960 [Bacteriovoracaceae bacterium]